MKSKTSSLKTNSACSSSKKNNNRGFTLIELMVVVVILGILSSISAVSMRRMIARAQEAGLKAMVKNVNYNVYSNLSDYDLKHIWVSQSRNTSYLNGKLETVLENKDYDNYFNHKNPFSKSKVILNYSSIPGSFQNPAVYVTNASKYSYDKLPALSITKDLKGSVVVYMDNEVQFIDVYYVDMAGRKSLLNLRINNEGKVSGHHD